MKHKTIWAILLPAAVVAGCTTSTIGVDLSIRGVLSFLISRESASATAHASASVGDNTSIFTFELEGGQGFSIDGIPFRPPLIGAQHTADVGAVNAPGSYSIDFHDRGDTTNMAVSPPADFTSVTPAAGTQVSKTGFTITWTPSGEADVLVDIIIDGLEPDGTDDDSAPEFGRVSLRNLADNGMVSVGAGNLNSFLPGDITVTFIRFRTITQSLGFESGEVRVEIFQNIALMLSE